MELLKFFGKSSWGVVKYILMIMLLVILTISLGALIAFIQSLIFVPHEYILWTVHDSSMRLIYIFEIIFAYLIFRFINKKKPIFEFISFDVISSFYEEYKSVTRPVSAVILSLILYYMIFNASVVFDNKIVNHTFLNPKGKEYSYSDIKSINTGIYGSNAAFVHSKGEFYYIIELKDGTKINLNSSGGTKDDKDTYLTILELDKIFVDNGIPKTSDKSHFDLVNFDQIYKDRIKGVLDNVK